MCSKKYNESHFFKLKKKKSTNSCPQPKSLWLCKSHLLQGSSCLESIPSSVIFYFCDLGENRPLKASIPPSFKLGKNPCSEEIKGCLYPGGTECGDSYPSKERSWRWISRETTPQAGGPARRDIFPPHHQRAMFWTAAPPDHGSGVPSLQRLSPPRGDAGWRWQWWRGCVSGGGGTAAGRSGPGSPRPEGGGGGGLPVPAAWLMPAARVGAGRGGPARRAAAASAVPG